MLKRLHKVSLSKWKKATLFPPSLPAKAPVCAGNWRLVCLHGETHKRSLITKPNWVLMSSLCSLRSKKCSVPSLCNWRLGGVGGWQIQGIRERWVCPVRFLPSYLTFAILLGYITQLPLNMFHEERSSYSIGPSPLREPCKRSSALEMHLCLR